jgi:hypothetical protein
MPRGRMVERRASSSTSWGSLVRVQYRPSVNRTNRPFPGQVGLAGGSSRGICGWAMGRSYNAPVDVAGRVRTGTTQPVAGRGSRASTTICILQRDHRDVVSAPFRVALARVAYVAAAASTGVGSRSSTSTSTSTGTLERRVTGVADVPASVWPIAQPAKPAVREQRNGQQPDASSPRRGLRNRMFTRSGCAECAPRALRPLRNDSGEAPMWRGRSAVDDSQTRPHPPPHDRPQHQPRG